MHFTGSVVRNASVGTSEEALPARAIKYLTLVDDSVGNDLVHQGIAEHSTIRFILN